MSEGKKVSESYTEFTQMVMPNDANPLGNLMGGNLMRWMDIAGGICAAKHASNFVVTASVDNVSFTKPIKVGDVVTIKAQITRAFSTSMEIYIEVFKNSLPENNLIATNNAYFTFVSIDRESYKPTKIKPVIPESDKEIQRYEGASRRRELRLILGGKMDPKDAIDLRQFFRELD
ncbi:MAG: acyl-CoA thioesterase [Saprospiraceae bacterium]